jgi:hypothetical protein
MAKLGTFSLGGRGVTLSQGRGRNKTVVLDVSFKELEIWAAKNGIDERRLWTKSYGRACKGLRDKLQKVITRSGGVEGVPKFKDFEQFTKELRAKRGRTSPMGGILNERHVIVSYKIGDTQFIGWPKRLAKWAVNFQDAVGNNDLADNSWRHYWHELGIKDIPREYAHNPRRVLPEPFGAYVDKHLKEWAQGAFYKDLARQMAKRRTT